MRGGGVGRSETLLLPLAFRGPGAVLFGLGIFCFAATMTVVAIVLVTYRHRSVPADMLPRVVATTRVVTSGGAPIGALVAGGVAIAFGVRSALFAVAALGAIVPLCASATGEIRRRTNLEDA